MFVCAQITSRSRKLNILNKKHFRYRIHGGQSRKSRFQIRTKYENFEAGPSLKKKENLLLENFRRPKIFLDFQGVKKWDISLKRIKVILDIKLIQK